MEPRSTPSRSPGPGYEIREIGSFHVGGRIVTLAGLPTRELPIPGRPRPLLVDRNGDYTVEQTYVHYVLLTAPRATYPIVMIHGGGLTGVTWETTPDGRPGWQSLFLERGLDVYITDQTERGRAGFAPPEIWPDEPVYPNATLTWELFRMGPPGTYASDPALRRPFANTKFPVEAFDTLMKQRVPYWGALHQDAAQRSYDELVARIGPCILMAHSSGGPYAFRAAVNAPGAVKAVIAIEPAGAPPFTEADALRVRDTPHLFVWGDDRPEDPVHGKPGATALAWHETLVRSGAASTSMDLPELGIRGNSHMLMMDTNNREIAGLIHAWIDTHVRA